ncbi:MAG: hypothetical protein DHS20C21_05940 [Gemmatimonadota bacterium]|nr:MAG: hypothetical protein DHS20C21_05940 [Gemmatimonadota bacterium]
MQRHLGALQEGAPEYLSNALQVDEQVGHGISWRRAFGFLQRNRVTFDIGGSGGRVEGRTRNGAGTRKRARDSRP